MLAVCCFIPRCFLTGKYKDSIWPKGTSLESTESIYVKIVVTACVSDELCRLLKEEEEEDRQIVRLGD